MGKSSRDKGIRREREIVNMHRDAGIKAERVPLSGASRYKGNGADIDVYVAGPDAAPWIAEAKARGDGEGFATIKRWLGDNDMLFLIEDGAKPLVLIPWERWLDVLEVIAGRPLPRHKIPFAIPAPTAASAGRPLDDALGPAGIVEDAVKDREVWDTNKRAFASG